MKRTIYQRAQALLLALVMVLGLVLDTPMSIGAEEPET